MKHPRPYRIRVIVFAITLVSLLIGIVMPGLSVLNTTARAYGKAASLAPAAPMQSSTNTCSVTVTVPGTSNPWLAGMPNGSTVALGDQAPAQSPIHVTGIAISPGTNLTFEASGKVSFTPDVNSGNGPDGGANGSHTPGVENGIGQVLLTWNSLVGLFLDDSQPNSSPAPTTALSFHTPASRDYLTFAPGLKQPFFIGDGKTSTGAAQQITVPVGATRLFLGTMDGIGWFNNSGTFTVNINRTPCNPSPCEATLVVPGTSNPYLAGMPAGTTDNGWDSVPANSPVLASGIPVTGGGEFTFSATGLVHLGDNQFDPPDGKASYQNLHYSSNGIGGYLGPANALLGVFLTDAAPNATPAPAHSDLYTAAGGFDYLTNSPGLKQVFFIGDGKTSTGVTQKVIAPAGATRLFLATLDGFGWFNNVGSFTVTVNAVNCNTTTPTPPPVVTGGLPGDGGILGPGTTGNPGYVTTHVAGTGNAGCTIQMTISDPTRPSSTNNNRTLTTTVDASGNWSIDLTLDDCDPVIDIVQICGGVSSDPDHRHIFVDGTPPVFTNGGPSDGTTFISGGGGTSTIILNGSASDPNTSHCINCGGVSYEWFLIGGSAGGGNLLLGGGGTGGTLTGGGSILTIDLLHGDYEFEVVVTDTAGNILRKRCHRIVRLGLTITGGLPGDQGIYGPGDGISFGHVRRIVTGTGNPGCTVNIRVTDARNPASTRNNATYTAPIDAAGNWSLPLDLDDCDPVVEVFEVCDGVASPIIRQQIYVDGTPPSVGIGDGGTLVGAGGMGAIMLDAAASDAGSFVPGAFGYQWFLTDSNGGNRVPLCTGCPGTLTVNKPVGDYYFEVIVTDRAGNQTIKRCHRIVFDYATATGTFVIGDLNAAVNTQVTFWGAQWDRLNSLSGGAAPSSFKGFESETSTPPPSCGATWTTRPGNSPPPPSSIPAYMGVIVSSSITKSGSTISGNITRLVIVKTDAGYSSNPGHAGTGTVVMTLCQ